MDVSNSDQEFIKSEEGLVWKLGSGELNDFNKNHSGKKVQRRYRKFFKLRW